MYFFSFVSPALRPRPALLGAAGCVALVGSLGCAAGGGEGSEPEQVPGAPSASSAGGAGARSASGEVGAGPQLIGPGLAVEPGGVPANIGSETSCDGLDENNNGVIDDVDVGRDGLCDCLRIGFLGELASDAGNQTGAFEAWLEARSDIPVTHIGSDQPLTEATFEGLQVVVVGNLSRRASSGGFEAQEVEALHRWILQGGGLITLAGYTARDADVAPTAQLLTPTGLGYDYQGRGPGVLGMGAPPVLVDGIAQPDHPTLAGIDVMGVYNAYPVVGDGDVLITGDGFTLAMAKLLGEGHLIVFSDEWITQDALWSDNPPPRQLSPCEQGCRQCEMRCESCDRQCTACEMQPCQGGQDPAPGEPCVRGCDQACQSCSGQCGQCQATCDACIGDVVMGELDVPRFWLNSMRWLTPANECQVPVPTIIR